MNTQMYDAQADSINVNDIATSQYNRDLLRYISRNVKGQGATNGIQLWIRDVVEDDTDYRPEGVHDMGWLGYFVGKNDHIEELFIRDFEPPSGVSFMEMLESFLIGVNNSKSITTLNFRIDLLGGRVFTMLGPFFENSATLAHLTIDRCTLADTLGDEGWRLLALAIGSSKNQSLVSVSLTDNSISDEGLVDIITSLSMHPHLQHIDLTDNLLNEKGCKALATLIQNSATELQYLDLGDNELEDESIYALVPALKNCHRLNTLRLSRNELITNRGWQQLASILEPPDTNLTTLRLNNLDDEVVTAFIGLLVNNHRLRHLYIGDTSNNMKVAFSKLLCDTTSVDSTYLSNHTITYLGVPAHQNQLRPLLDLNKREDKNEVAMIKILQTHNGINMTQFFEWEFKVLPLMINWLERASTIIMPAYLQPNIEPRKLSSIYQFVRGMPLLYVETCLSKELEDTKAAQKQSEETIEEEKRKLVLLQERKTSIMKRLGQPSTK